MMRFIELLDPACVAVGVDAGSKAEALEAAAKTLAAGGKAHPASEVLKGLLEREQLTSTGIGEGIAVPHTQTDAVRTTTMAVVRLARPVPFDSIDGEPVDLLFLLAGPPGSSATHLQLLSKLARVLHDEAFREAARKAPDAQSLAGLLFERD